MLIFRFHRLGSRYRASEIKTDHHISPHTYTTSRISSRDSASQVASRTVCSSTRDNGKTESNIAPRLRKGFGLLRNVVRKIVHACHDWFTRAFSLEYIECPWRGILIAWHELFQLFFFILRCCALTRGARKLRSWRASTGIRMTKSLLLCIFLLLFLLASSSTTWLTWENWNK